MRENEAAIFEGMKTKIDMEGAKRSIENQLARAKDECLSTEARLKGQVEQLRGEAIKTSEEKQALLNTYAEY